MNDIFDFFILVLEILVLLIKASIIVYILMYLIYVFTLSNFVKTIEPENRFIQPYNALFLLIPGFSLIYQFYFYFFFFKSIRKELHSTNFESEFKKEEALFFISSLLNIITTWGFVYILTEHEFTSYIITIFIFSLTMIILKIVKLNMFKDKCKQKNELI